MSLQRNKKIDAATRPRAFECKGHGFCDGSMTGRFVWKRKLDERGELKSGTAPSGLAALCARRDNPLAGKGLEKRAYWRG